MHPVHKVGMKDDGRDTHLGSGGGWLAILPTEIAHS